MFESDGTLINVICRKYVSDKSDDMCLVLIICIFVRPHAFMAAI